MNRSTAHPRPASAVPAGTILGLDTRRVDFQVTADLTGAADLVDLAYFEGTEAMGTALPVAVVSHAAGFIAGVDLGWRVADTLAAEVNARAGDLLTLAATVESLRRALFERQGARELSVAFSTTIAFPRGVQASAERRVRITPLVRAPAPGVRVRVQPLDVNRPDPVAGHRLGAIEISLPGDVALEDTPEILIELHGADLPGEAIGLLLPPVGTEGLRLTRMPPLDDARLSRWLLGFADPRAAAGQVVSLDVAATPAAVLSAIDRRARGSAPASASAALSFSVAARLTGWAPMAQPSHQGEGARRLWRVNAPEIVSPVHGADHASVAVGLNGSGLVWDLDAGQTTARAGAVEASFTLDALRSTLRLPQVLLAIDGWPLARVPEITVETRVATSGGAPLRETLALRAEPGLTRRSGRLALALDKLGPELVARIERELGGKAIWSGMLDVCLRAATPASAETAPSLTVSIPLLARPSPRRFPVVVDCGATAISVWVGMPQEDGLAGPLKRVTFTADGALLPGVLAAEPAAGMLPMPPLPMANDLPCFMTDAAAPRIASARRRGAPRMAMASGSLAAQAPGETRRPAELMADAIAGLIIGHVLPALPNLRRPDEVRARLIPRIVLTVPSDVGPQPANAWAGVRSRLAARLEPWFPGIETMPDAVALLPEPVAAGRHAIARMADAGSATGRPELVVSLDIGATATQVGVFRFAADRTQPLAAFGLPVGGDTLHDALLGLVADWVDQTQAALGERVRALHDDGPLGPFAVDRSAQRPEDGRFASLDLLSEAVAEGQIALAGAAPGAGPDAEAWTGPSATPFRVVLARFGGRGPARGVLLPQGPVEAGEGEVTPGVRWRIGPAGADGRQALELVASPEAFAGEAPGVQRLSAVVRFLAVTAPRLAMSAIPAGAERIRRTIVPSGRGALWPPLLAVLKQEAERFGDRVLPALNPAEMKNAVAAGAAILCAEGQVLSPGSSAPAYDAPLAIAVQAVRASPSGETVFVVERLFYLAGSVAQAGRAYEAENAQQPSLSGRVTLGRRFVLARVLPGLDPAGRLLREWRGVAGEAAPEPVRPLDGDALADAQSEGLSVFGPCDIVARPLADGALQVVVRALDNDWSATWRISGGSAVRVRASGRGEG